MWAGVTGVVRPATFALPLLPSPAAATSGAQKATMRPRNMVRNIGSRNRHMIPVGAFHHPHDTDGRGTPLCPPCEFSR
jgi:hypothetical protein